MPAMTAMALDAAYDMVLNVSRIAANVDPKPPPPWVPGEEPTEDQKVLVRQAIEVVEQSRKGLR